MSSAEADAPARPVGPDAVEPVPHGRTAQRLTWKFLPTPVRSLVEERLGSPVVDATSQDAGFTPGFASVLTGADGNRLFVKAASVAAQKQFAEAYLEEARKLRLLGDRIPAPRLLWVHEPATPADWVVLGFEAVDGRAPRRPWRPDELGRTLDLAEEIAETTREVPDALRLRPLHEDLPALLTGWADVPAEWPHRDEAAELAAAYPQLPDADRFVHSDLRDDNVLLCRDGGALACDWNWPALGPDWIDLVTVLASAHGDGLEVEDELASRALTRDVPAEHVDAWLAALCGFMLSARQRPPLPTSPYLRVHASWWAEALWSWLAARRGWA